MEIFLGTDICEISRIEKIYNKYDRKFITKIFTNKEREYCLSNSKNSMLRFAGRFAAKESVSKALGVGINGLGWSEGIDWLDVEIIRNANGSLDLKLTNKAFEISSKMGITNWKVSVSHSKEFAISTVIGYK